MTKERSTEVKNKVSEALDYIQKEYMGFIRWRIPGPEEPIEVENALDVVNKSLHATWLALAVANQEPVISVYDLLRIDQKFDSLCKAQTELLAALEAQEARY